MPVFVSVGTLIVLGTSYKAQAVSLLEVLMVFICSTRVSFKPTFLKKIGMCGVNV